MKKIAGLLLIFFIGVTANAQLSVEDLVNQGIEYHDNGDYDKAIETYKMALAIDPESTLVHYEMSYTYLEKKDYEKALEHSRFVIKKKTNNLREAYTIYGTTLDILGRTEESIAAYKEGIAVTEPYYLLYYNLALDYYKLNDYENAKTYLLDGLNLNFSHGSSHLLLAQCNSRQGNKTEAIVGSLYFMLLESNTKRTEEAYNLVMSNFSGNVSKDKDNPNAININTSLPEEDSKFGIADLMMSMITAANYTKENEGKTKARLFTENMTSFLEYLGELESTDENDIYFNDYISFLVSIAKSKHMETFCMFILHVVDEDANQWLADNPEKLDAFGNWLDEE